MCAHLIDDVIKLYKVYYQDGLIGPDLVELLIVWARIPDNKGFVDKMLPLVSEVVG